jgi:acetylornithine deacetylase
VAARLRGAGGGRSLVLSGHIDTVPRGAAPWTRDPFGGEISAGRLYGRGSCDMKSGIAIALYVLEELVRGGARLRGDLIFESVVDEEFGGVNGTLAGRVRGYRADAAIITEPSALRICPAQRGGRVLHLTFRSPADIFSSSREPRTVIDQAARFLERLRDFAAARSARAPRHPLYAHVPHPVPVSVTNLSTGGWGWTEPMTVPSLCRVELFFQAMPGETEEELMAHFRDWLGTLEDAPEVEAPIRWLPGSAISPDEPLVRELAACARETLGQEPPVQGIEAPCDMYVFHHFGIPAVLWGAAGANMHAPDEYVEIASLDAAARVLANFVRRWCGVAS